MFRLYACQEAQKHPIQAHGPYEKAEEALHNPAQADFRFLVLRAAVPIGI
jgi:hypothetical protein